MNHDRIDGKDVYSSENGTLQIWRPAAGVVSLALDGKLDLEFASLILNTYDDAVSSGAKLDIFADWAEMKGYSSQTRSSMTIWCEANRSRINTLNVLLGSEISRLRVGIVNEMLAGMITTFTDRGKYEAALHRAVDPAEEPDFQAMAPRAPEVANALAG